MTEDQQPAWVESDGVSNLPTVAGVYALRPRDGALHYAYFDGEAFCGTAKDPKRAAQKDLTFFHTRQFKPHAEFPPTNDAWWDYQGLMAKSQATSFDAKLNGTVMTVTSCDGIISVGGAIMGTDEPGIAAMAERNKPAPEPEKVIVGGLTIDMADLVEFLKAKQPKPEPNTTPQGILTMWNEGADHRLGMWRTME